MSRCKDIPKDETPMYKHKVNYLNSDGMDESPLAGDEIYEKELEKIIVKGNNKYIKKLELGKMIYENGGRRCSTSFTTTYERTSGFIFEDKCGIISYRC